MAVSNAQEDDDPDRPYIRPAHRKHANELRSVINPGVQGSSESRRYLTKDNCSEASMRKNRENMADYGAANG